MDDIYVYCSNEEVSKYVSWNTHQNLDDTRDFVTVVINQYENNQPAPWGIEHKETSQFIGTIEFVDWKPKHKTAEIGYVIARDYWGMGLATEAVKNMILFGFQQMGLVRIQARCFTENTGSERVMKKAGMSFEGIIRKGMYSKGQHRDLKQYAIVKE
ncbi:GNAT family protein [Lentibacillus sp. N15]|uniref:GNAT family N-acetyltransferase n=1 Tax=Lentibacillus songyuanensis TaxID=3136161 RepID=UPI0031BA8620